MKLFKKKPTINILRLSGVISNSSKKDLSLKNLLSRIDKAFTKKSPKAVVLLIDCPGGSPVQSELISSYLIHSSKKHNIPLISFVEDVAASGGYWLACSAIEIYACSNSSIIGSIGVISASFGFDELINKIGIKRRVYTAGNSKSVLDPFLPEKESDVARLNKLLEQVHINFKNYIKQQRGAKLTGTEEELFNGNFWVAQEALTLGLIDGISDYFSFLKERYGENTNFNYIEEKSSSLKNLLSNLNINFKLNNIESLLLKSFSQKPNFL